MHQSLWRGRPVYPTTPYEARERAHHVWVAVGAMETSIDAFEAALRLFDHATELPADFDFRIPWRRIAADAGAMTIWHFRKALDGFSLAINQEPTIRDLANHDRIRHARNVMFRAKFPDFDEMRFGVAHRAERTLADTPHMIIGPQPNMPEINLGPGASVMAAGISERKIWMTVDGRQVSYELSQASLDALEAIGLEAVGAVTTEN